ncbi:MAG: class I SAM-dependent methyltransferase [Pirellulales bacterium]|nr:class I SAM-dependent methyltransferase [Pirellulales bacterium]
MSDDRYQLIDFGDGRKLESLAGYWIDRPSAAALGAVKRSPEAWTRVQSRFDSQQKSWMDRSDWPQHLTVDCGPFRMPLRATPYGHIGLFPEQADNWHWLARPPVGDHGGQGLNLFAYTGASTMAMVAAGLEAVHVDAAKPNVQAAKVAAELNGWRERKIRYLVDDAGKFAAREVRRKRRYHTIVLDPPAYGHGPSGKSWRIERDLWPLLENCLRLLDPASFRLLITGHSAEVGPDDVWRFLRQSRFIAQQGGSSGLRTEKGQSQLNDTFGRSLNAGFYLRVEKGGA